MKLFWFHLVGQAIKAAGIGAALMFSVSAGYAQRPVCGFEGAWSGNGTVALSDDTTSASGAKRLQGQRQRTRF